MADLTGVASGNPNNRESRIVELVRVLREAEAELQALAGGELDGVGGTEVGTHLLLSTAQAELRASERAQRELAEMQIGILNALPAHIALLDASGVIVAVNESWRRFASANALRSEDFAVGQNYIGICEASQGECSAEASAVARGIRDVIRGVLPIFTIEYPCHSPDEQRWYRLMATPLTSTPGSGAVVMHVNVTERRKAEEQLRQSEERFRLLIEGSERTLFYTHDCEHLFEYLSPSTSSVLGYAPQELVGQRRQVLIIPDDPLNADVQELTEKALRDGQPCVPYLAAVRHKDGRRIVLEILESPIYRDGAVVGIQGFAHDITERVRTQQDLAVSEAWFRGFFDQASVGMVVKSEDGHFVRVNSRFAEIIGRPVQYIVGQSYETFTHPEDHAAEAALLGKILTGKMESARWEKRYLRSDGATVWCTFSISAVRLAEGGKRQFIGVVEDISERLLSEEALRHGRDMLRIAGEVAKLGGWVAELNPLRLRWSDEVCAIHEVPAGYVPTLEEAIEFYAPEYREKVAHAVERCMQEGAPFSFELEIVTRAGRRIWVLAIGEAVRDDDGRVSRLQGAFQDISARKEAEASVAESQRRFRAMADSFPFIVWTAEPDGELDYANQRMIDYTQVDPLLPPATSWQPYVHPDDLPGAIAAWRVAIAEGESYTVAFRLREGTSGAYRWFRVQAEPIRNSDGRIVKWYGTGIDIHESRRLEQQAQSLAKRLSDTLESITDGFYTLDRSWHFSFLNTQAERMLNRAPRSLLGKNVWAEFPEVLGTTLQSQYERTMRSGEPAHFQDYYPSLDRWYDVSVYASDDGLAVYFRDVTQARNSLAQLRLLEASVSRLNDIVLITEAEPIVGEGPRIVFVNDAFVRRTGYSREEIIGKTPRILQGPKTQRAELDRIRNALMAWQPVRAELINYTKTGEEYWIELEIVPLPDANGWYTHWVSVERDITERKRTAEQLHQSQRLESIGQLTGGVAHDFNNLLTVILGNAELLEEQLQGQGCEDLAAMIVQAAQRGADLTQRLLAFARRQALDPSIVDVNRLATNLEPLLRRTLGEQIQLRLVRQNGELWPALVDRSQLENALLNLCLNARDAMPSGGRLTVETANVQLDLDYADRYADVMPGPYVMLAVSDQGVGMPPEILGRVFEPFFTTKERGRGTGLGLAMVYGFVKQSGGHVNIYSEPGQGTTVKLYLPRAQVSTEISNGDMWAISAPQIGGSEHILLVEDEDLVRQHVEQVLQALGYQVRAVSDPLLALEVLRSNDPVDLLFTDVVMPHMGGRDLATQAGRIRPGLRILFTSGYTENAVLHNSHLDPEISLLSKPYRKEELARKVREALDR